MAALPNSFVFAQVPSTAAENAFEFHRNFASKDLHIHPRIESEIVEFAQSGHLFGVRRKNTNEFVGLYYVAQNSAESDWQLGGVTVTVQKQGIGQLLVRFALAHTIVLCTGFYCRKASGFRRSSRPSAMTITLLEDC